MPGFTTLTKNQRASLDDFVSFSKTFAIAKPPADDLIPLLARGEREQTALVKSATEQASAPGAKQPLPRIYISSKFQATSPTMMALKLNMPSPKTASSEPDISLRKPVPSSANNVGAKSFHMQNREVDAAKAHTPNMHTVGPSNTFGGSTTKPPGGCDDFKAPSGVQNGSVGDVIPYQGKKKKGLKGKKFNGDRPPLAQPDQPKAEPQNEQAVDNGNGVVRKFNPRHNDGSFSNKHRDGGSFNKPGGPGRFNRATSFHENQIPRKQFNDNPGFLSYRSDHRREFLENPHRHFLGNTPTNRKVAPDADFRPARHHPHIQHMQGSPVDPMGYHSPHGSWYPHQHAQVMVAQHMHHGPPPGFVPVMAHPPPHLAVMMPHQQHGRPPAHLQEHVPHMPHVPNMPPHAVTTSPTDTGGHKTPSKSYTSSTSSVVTVVPASACQNNSAQQIAVPTTDDPRPAHIRIESLVTTITSELEDLKLRITPSTQRAVTPADMARYLDTAMGMCKAVQAASQELTEENKVMKQHLDASARKHKQQQSNDHNGVKIGGASRSHSASPQRAQPVGGTGTMQIDRRISMSNGNVNGNGGEVATGPPAFHGHGPWWLRKGQWQWVNSIEGDGKEVAGAMGG